MIISFLLRVSPQRGHIISCMNIPGVKVDSYCNVRVIDLEDLSILLKYFIYLTQSNFYNNDANVFF